jgi:hypothetical protein
MELDHTSLSVTERELLVALGIDRVKDTQEKLTKVCTKCGQTKSISVFELHSGYADGRRSMCRECRVIDHKAYYQKNKGVISIRSAMQRINKPREYWAYSTVCGHRSRGCTVLVERKQLIELAYKTSNCSICGVDLDWESMCKGGAPKNNSPSLDRVNCDTVLVINNVQIICSLCNLTKNSRTMEEFINYCKLVADRFTIKESKNDV